MTSFPVAKKGPFEQKMIQVISLYVFFLSVTILTIDIVETFRVSVMIVHMILVLSSATIYGFAISINNYEKLKTPLLILLYTSITLYWFLSTGINGPTGVGLFSVMTIAFIFSKPQNRKRTFYLNLVFVVVLAMGHYLFDDYMKYGFLLYKKSVIQYLVVGLGQSILLFFLKKEVDTERRLTEVKNEQLLHLNSSLKSTVASQFKTLQQLTSTQTKLMESERMASIGKLTAGLAHELNNPLNFVGGVVQPIKRDIKELESFISPDQVEKARYVTEEINVLLDSIETGTERATKVVQKLLNITPKGKTHEDFKTINFSELILDVARLVEKSNKKIEFIYDIDPDIYLEGSEIELSQVLLNLLRNSIQAMKKEVTGSISILCHQAGNTTLRIIDNGEGMDQETLENAFQAFYTTKGNENGTGLGLYISHEIIKNHEGNIAMSSQQGLGTEIKIVFPGTLLKTRDD